MEDLKTARLKAQALTQAAYAPYGDVIEANETMPFKPANFGRAKRFNHLAAPVNLRQGEATANVCVFRCSPWTESTLDVALLERHEHSTQIFAPMQSGKYVTIVALGADEPDISTLAAFIVDGPQGISYRPGIWHYPMTALEQPLDLVCLVFENDSAEDCDVRTLPSPVTVDLY